MQNNKRMAVMVVKQEALLSNEINLKNKHSSYSCGNGLF